jgi:hypothetical protein
MKPHKHAAIIKAWADGATIEWRDTSRTYSKDWRETCAPAWSLDYEYRVKPTPHKWQKEFDAWQAGKTLQFRRIGGRLDWIDWGCKPPNKWVPRGRDLDAESLEWRIKPEEEVQHWHIGLGFLRRLAVKDAPGDANLKLTFEDGKLIKAEVL